MLLPFVFLSSGSAVWQRRLYFLRLLYEQQQQQSWPVIEHGSRGNDRWIGDSRQSGSSLCHSRRDGQKNGRTGQLFSSDYQCHLALSFFIIFFFDCLLNSNFFYPLHGVGGAACQKGLHNYRPTNLHPLK